MTQNLKLTQFYKGKRVFVSGHTGFKGSWLCLALAEMGCAVTGYALAPEDNPDSLYDLSNLARRITSHEKDIRDFSTLRHCVQQSQPDIVFHMAAQSLVLPSYEDPVGTYSTNVMGTVYLLEAVRQAKSVKAVVNVTTDKCYENNETASVFSENDPLGGFDPYSSSKAAAEIASASYRRSFLAKEGIAMATARAGNVIGGGDFSRHRLIPDIVRAVKSGDPVNLRNPDSIRPWQYVLDVLYGYLLLGQRLYETGAPFAEAFNFGPDESGITAGEIADRLVTAFPSAPTITRNVPQAGRHEARTLYLDNRKAKTVLGWSSRLNSLEAIEATVEWYNRYLKEPEAMERATVEQLADYLNKAAA